MKEFKKYFSEQEVNEATVKVSMKKMSIVDGKSNIEIEKKTNGAIDIYIYADEIHDAFFTIPAKNSDEVIEWLSKDKE